MPPVAPKPPRVVNVTWAGEQRFDVLGSGKAPSRIDADSATGPGPFDTMLGAFAACSATDALDILKKRRTPAERFSITITGERAPAIPARLVRATLEFHIDGPGIDREGAEHAVELSVAKYCSVGSSLDPAIPVLVSVTLNGTPGKGKEVTPALRGQGPGVGN